MLCWGGVSRALLKPEIAVIGGYGGKTEKGPTAKSKAN